MWDNLGDLCIAFVSSIFLCLFGIQLLRAYRKEVIYFRGDVFRKDEPMMFWICVSICVLGAVLSMGLAMTGFGSILIGMYIVGVLIMPVLLLNGTFDSSKL